MFIKRFKRTLVGAVVVLGCILAAIFILSALNYTAHEGHGDSQFSGHAHGHGHSHNGEAQEYTCSMHPSFRSTNPNDRCPICGMELIPVVARSAAEDNEVSASFSGRSLALLQVQTEQATVADATLAVRLSGVLDFDERNLTSISAYTGGRIERLFVNFNGASVAAGEPLVKLYSPELLLAQQELLQVSQFLGQQETASENYRLYQNTYRAGRARLRLLGMSSAQIDALVERGYAEEFVVIPAPSSGLVINRNVSQGDYVATGDTLLTIADSEQLWLVLEAFERDVQHFRVGQQVSLTIAQAQQPSTKVQGEIVALAPKIDDMRRTRSVRIALAEALPNPIPGAFVQATVHIPREQVLTIPASAPLITGLRAVVYVQDQQEPGRFLAREVELGARLDDRYEILTGLTAGEWVVSRGAFRIDSELQLRGQPSMMGAVALPEHAHGESSNAQQQHQSPAEHNTLPLIDVDMQPLFAAYHSLWNALQGDDLERWQSAAMTFEHAVADISWPPALADQLALLQTGSGHFHHVERLSVAREHFFSHSQAMIRLAEAGYHHGELHLMFCPMARRGEGAHWLQQDNELLNPYFGSRMLRCGDVQRVLLGEAN